MIFPLDRLRPQPAILRGSPGSYNIEIPLEPFTLPLYPDEEDLEVETSIHLDGTSLPFHNWSMLRGRRFEIPVNPADGSIDGSVYIEHAHHPVDVRSISFDDAIDGTLMARLRVTICFEFEGLGDYSDIDTELVVEFPGPAPENN